MKILAFPATNSRQSINRALVTHTVAILETEILPDAEVTLLDLNEFEMPIYSIDRENADGIPSEAHAFFNAIGAADAVLVSYAEHNGSVTTAWKNLFDWMSRIDTKLWQGKPIVMLAATPGPRAGAGVLGNQETLAPFFGGDVRSTLGLGKWGETWDAENQTLRHSDDSAALRAALSAFKQQAE